MTERSADCPCKSAMIYRYSVLIIIFVICKERDRIARLLIARNKSVKTIIIIAICCIIVNVFYAVKVSVAVIRILVFYYTVYLYFYYSVQFVIDDNKKQETICFLFFVFSNDYQKISCIFRFLKGDLLKTFFQVPHHVQLS